MPIYWTLVVLGTLLQGMRCNADDTSTASKGTPPLTTLSSITSSASLASTTLTPTPTSLVSTKATTSSASLASTALTATLTSLVSTKATTSSASLASTALTATLTSLGSTKVTTSSASLASTALTATLTSLGSTKAITSSASLASTALAPTLTSSEPPDTTLSSSPNFTTQAPPMTTKGTSPEPTGTSSTVTNRDLSSITNSKNDLVTTIQPKTSNAGPTPTAFNNNPENSTTKVITTNPIQVTTNLNKPATSISTDSTTQLLSTQTTPSDVARNSTLSSTAAPDSKSTASQSLGTTKAQTTNASIIPGQRSDENTSTSTHSYDLSSSTEENIVRQACKTLGQKMKGNCSVTITIHDKRLIAEVTIDADQEIPPGNYQPTKKPVSGVTNNDALQKDDENKDTIPETLIAILASCGALVLILCCFAAYCTYHRRSYRKNQQHLTEELQTVENGYHDNPTLEVMEIQPEMQEKKLTLNGEFNDSWIVPIDNLLKEDITDEEDTHL